MQDMSATDWFWSTIHDTHEQAGHDNEQQLAILQEWLPSIEADYILSWGQEFNRVFEQLNHWDIWAGAYIIRGGCSDDAFDDFRGTLISFGKDTVESVIESADNLVILLDKYLFDDPEDELCIEGFQYLAMQAYESTTGTAWPVSGTNEPTKGTMFGEDNDSLKRICPRLYNRFSDHEQKMREDLAKAADFFRRKKYKSAIRIFSLYEAELGDVDRKKLQYARKALST